MKALVDTNVLIRHLTGDPPAMAARSTAYLSSTRGLGLSDLVVAEMVYVLESFYRVPRRDLVGLIKAVLSSSTVQVQDPRLLFRALDVYEIHRIDFTEAYLVATAEKEGISEVVSFDRVLDRVGTIMRIEP